MAVQTHGNYKMVSLGCKGEGPLQLGPKNYPETPNFTPAMPPGDQMVQPVGNQGGSPLYMVQIHS